MEQHKLIFGIYRFWSFYNCMMYFLKQINQKEDLGSVVKGFIFFGIYVPHLFQWMGQLYYEISTCVVVHVYRIWSKQPFIDIGPLCGYLRNISMIWGRYVCCRYTFSWHEGSTFMVCMCVHTCVCLHICLPECVYMFVSLHTNVVF